MKKGFVALVGAGPGDKGLMTIKGLDLLKKAEVVVFDRLVSNDILKLMPEEAEKINVGKQINYHPVKQDEINQILLQKALEGKFVVRLKGGDPFVFGRGAEELELLNKNHISYEVVPGITSSISALCYAGIPATHRDLSSSFHIITGHAKESGELDIAFESLVHLKGTIVFLMGVSSITFIVKGLLEAGMDKNTPAAIVENGTRAFQRKTIGTLSTLEEKANENNIKSPAIIAVGAVCGLSESFDWFSKKPLIGKKILVTSPANSAGKMSGSLYELGADVNEFSCIRIAEITDNVDLENACSQLSTFSWILFASKNGVELFFKHLYQRNFDARNLANIKIAAVGNQTKKALLEYGIICDYVPDVFDGDHMAEGVLKQINIQDKVLVLDALITNNDLVSVFENKGVQCQRVPLYDTVFHCEEGLVGVLEDCDYIAFTSASAVEGMVKAIGKRDFSKYKAICIGKQTAKVAKDSGFECFISKEATIDSMIDCLLEVCNVKSFD